MAFIILHDADHPEWEYRVNFEHVVHYTVAIYGAGESSTLLRFVDGISTLLVKETPKEIDDLLPLCAAPDIEEDVE